MKHRRRSIAKIIALALFCVAGPIEAFAQQAPALPGGATSLNETHGDWTVACALQEDVKHCALSQQQLDPQSRQRLIAIELTLAAKSEAGGVLVLPFGLALDKGVALKVDEGDPLPALAFRTCLPAGCIVPLTFSSDTLAALRKGKQIKLDAIADGGKPVSFNISLAGLSGALDRLTELTKN